MGDAKEGFKKASTYSTIDPEAVFIQDDPKGPFYDKRIDLPIIPETLANIIALGVQVPIIVSQLDGKNYVVEGRQRVKHWREAIKHWEKHGEPIRPLLCILRQIKQNDGEFIGVSLNEHRQSDTPMLRIEKASRMLTLGIDEDSVANAFGISVAQLKNWLKADMLCKPVKKLIEEGKIPVTAAAKFCTLPPDEQKVAVQELIDSGVKPTVKNATKAASGGKVEKARKGWTKARMIEYSTRNEVPNHFQIMLAIVAGELADSDANGVEGLEWMK